MSEWSQLTPSAETPKLHAPTHSLGGTDPVSVVNLAGYPGGITTFLRADSTFAIPPGGSGGGTTPSPHATTHQAGGTDIVDVKLLGGFPADNTKFLNGVGAFSSVVAGLHAPTHSGGGTDPVSILNLGGYSGLINTVLRGNATWGTPPLLAHAPSHQTGGADIVDVKLLGGYPGGTVNFLRADGTFALPSGGVPGLHHTTHEIGGTDVIQNVAWTNQPNIFTATPQTINANVPGIVFTDPIAGVDSRYWKIATVGSSGIVGYIIMSAVNASGTGSVTGSLTLDRAGNLQVTGSITAGTATGGNVALLNAANTFTQDQLIQKTNPGIGFKYIGNTSYGRINQNIGTGSRIDISSNLFWNGTDSIADDTSVQSAQYTQLNGNHFFFSAPAGANPRSAALINILQMNTTGGALNGNFSVNYNIAGGTGISVRNTLAGNNYSQVMLGNDIANLTMGMYAISSTAAFGGDSPAGAGVVRANTTGGLSVSSYTATPIRFYTNQVERARITPTGDLYINAATSLYSASLWMSVDQGSRILGIGIQNTSISNGIYFLGFYNSTGATPGYILQTSATTVSYTTTSDKRLKKDLGRAVDLTSLRSVVIHDFEWKTDKIRDRGIFAQDAYELFPRAIFKGTDELTKSGDLKQPWAIESSKLVYDLIVGWQEHDTIIADLKAEIAKLKTLINDYNTKSINN